jgi:hypothetical protein
VQIVLYIIVWLLYIHNQIFTSTLFQC